jgi:pimeloyl-ACP methyl ester carboxylesterase
MDLPAFGLTGPFLKRDYTISNYTTFLKEFLDSLNIKHCILVGNSLGGEIAWKFAIQEPVMTKKLILLDPSGYPVISKSVPIAFKLAKIPVLNKFLTYITPRFLVRASIENVYFDKSKVSDSLVNRYFDLTLRKGNRKAIVDRLKISTTLTNGTKTHDNIKNIKQPTLIIWGSDDQLIPVENGYKFKNDITNSKLIVMQQTGHVPMEEKPLISLNFAIDFINN